MKAAAAAGDDERLAACLSPAGRDDECTGAIFRLVMSDAILKPTKGELPANVRAFMGRHGIDPALLRSCSNADKSKSVAQAIQETYLHRLADKPAFIADFWRLMDKYDAKREDPPKPASAAELKDVKIAGDQAEASVVMTIDAEEVAKSIKFRKIGRTWLVDEEDRIMSALRTRQADRAAPERAESPSLPE